MPTILLEGAVFKNVWMKRSLATCIDLKAVLLTWFVYVVCCLRLIRATCGGDTTIQLASQLGNWVDLGTTGVQIWGWVLYKSCKHLLEPATALNCKSLLTICLSCKVLGCIHLKGFLSTCAVLAVVGCFACLGSERLWKG